ncbi:DUF1285 domain-containing protein [Sphingomonas sp.]|uniref:DUF1285 domain-containing protein n=1 Tax=Sphingomonas sp. TaxID=28214 RepID=UPI003B3AD4BD
MPERAPPPPTLSGLSIAEIAAIAAAHPDPPVDQWDPPFCGDSGMRIARDGTWFHDGTPISRPAMVRLFSGLLRREPDGAYMLVTPVEKLAIAVDDAPFVAVELMTEGQERDRRLAFRLNTDRSVIAGANHPLTVRDGRPYLEVRPGIDAAIARAVYYELADLALAEGADPAGLWSDGVRFSLDAA